MLSSEFETTNEFILEFKSSISKELNLKTQEKIKERALLFSKVNDGRTLLKQLQIPYLKMPVPYFDHEAMLREAINLKDRFVSHRSSDSRGWKSLCLHGLEDNKTLAYEEYGYQNEQQVPYQWTQASQLCPVTTKWLKTLLEQKYFTRFFRVRFMWLEPGGYIRFHRDRKEGEHSLGPLNVALNMPQGCHWLFRNYGEVPFPPGTANCVDISNDHGVWNDSNEDRIHLIVHGEYGDAYYDGLVRGKNAILSSMGAQNSSTTSASPIPQLAFRANNRPLVALWSYTQDLDSSQFTQTLEAMTLHFLKLRSSRVEHIIRDHSLNRILDLALSQGHQWCSVFTPGSYVRDGIYNTIEQTCLTSPSDVALYAHILDRKERGFGIHSQFFIVNLQAWAKAGKPRFGFKASEKIQLKKPKRSDENIHDDYTPLWLKPGSEDWGIKPRVPGWNWIQQFLAAGYQIKNIPQSIRGKKGYLYPQENTAAVSELIVSLRKSEDYIKTLPLSDHQMELAVELAVESGDVRNKIFTFNTEGLYDLSDKRERKPLDLLCTVSAGFKDLHILRRHQWTPDGRILYFDISTQALAFKKFLFNEWDGRNYPEFLISIMKEGRLELEGSLFAVNDDEVVSKWQKELKLWGSEDEFQKHFLKVKALPKSFVHIDILTDPLALARQTREIQPKSAAIWYSNCFNYTPTVASRNWDMSSIEFTGLQFLNSIHQASLDLGNDIYLYGEDPTKGSRCEHFSLLANDFWG